MGLAASQARFLGLTARKSDKEYQGQRINQARTQLADSTDVLFEQVLSKEVPDVNKYPIVYDANGKPTNDTNGDGLSNEYDEVVRNYSLAYDKANLEVEQLHIEDRALETRLKSVDSEHNAIQTEMDAVKKVIEKNIEGTFKTFG